jgi:DNA mismatch repair protein MutS2
VSDILNHLQRARIGAILEAPDLLAVMRFVSGTRRLREALLQSPAEEFPFLHCCAEAITPQPVLEKAIGAAIDEVSGDIRDDASLKLLKARRNMRQTQSSIQTRLRDMLADTRVQPFLQDNFVTVREGRYCLPVRAECRANVPGIVHDRSGSGGAYFIEPQAVVEANNRLRELQIEEREAILEILTDLSRRVNEVNDTLMTSLQAAADLDFAFAKGSLSRELNAIEPVVTDAAARSGFALLQARHPLIENCVPNDIFLGDGSSSRSLDPPTEDDFDVILITGPNTGGKTVVLKTLGLLTCMAACGLHLPVAEESWLSLPGAVYADIGDEQSIEQSLSTFSSHMKQIIRILRKAQGRDLVLLDEIGAGTDPDEGAALAKAVLRALQRRGVRVLATTHYGELKQFALGAARFENASVEFDSRTLRPTYHLRISVPGSSNALEIAARLGMPPELVQRARRYLGRDRAEAEAAVQRLEETQRELSEQAAGAQREREEVERLRRDYEKKLTKLQRESEEQLTAAQREAADLVRAAQEQADAILRDLRQAGQESRQTEEARRRLKTLREKTLRRASSPLAPASETTAGTTPNAPPTQFPEIGHTVRVRSVNREGILLSKPNDNNRVEVRLGSIKLEVPAGDIESVAQRPSTVGGVSAIRLRKAISVPEEINLIGKTSDEALPELEKYLDDALLAEAEQVRVIHGRGSGALRTAIHKWLKRQHAVRSFHLAPPGEGGEGATIVELG